MSSGFFPLSSDSFRCTMKKGYGCCGAEAPKGFPWGSCRQSALRNRLVTDEVGSTQLHTGMHFGEFVLR